MSFKTRTAINVPSLPPVGRAPRLVMLQGPDIGRQVQLGDGTVEIGRGEEATVRVDSDLISRRHACIACFGVRYLIRDMGSTNGTYVNGKRLEKPHELAEGDQIKVGKVILRYTDNPVEAAYHERIVEQARVDQLTQAFNKAHFHEEIGRAVKRVVARAPVISLIVFDIDHFKKINDTHGHPAGDAVLSTLADVVRAQLPGQALFARVGGEEFAVLLEGDGLSEARALAEQIRGAVEATPFAHGGESIPVTVSLGVAELAGEQDDKALYGLADERLYEAKRSGRNRVC